MAQVKRVSLFACILAFVFLFAAMPPHAAGAADGEAENLSKLCKYDGDFSVHADRLKDDDFDTAQRVNKGKTLSISWKDDVPVASVYLSFYYAPVAYTVMQFDASGAFFSITISSKRFPKRVRFRSAPMRRTARSARCMRTARGR